MIGVGLIIEEALTVRDQVGPVAEVTWSKVQATGTVMWLNEAQFYLDIAADGLGEQVAAGLRELLRNPARAPVLAVIWRVDPARRRRHLHIRRPRALARL